MVTSNISHGFGPYIDAGSRTLILGSFPSVKSREAAFFYGHPQNRFWKVLEGIFEDNIIREDSTESGLAGTAGLAASADAGGAAFDEANCESMIVAKKAFLRRHHIALYDVIESCTITGSSDSSIKDVVPADILALLNAAPIERIFVNGKTAKKYYDKYLYTLCGQTAVCLPSTSPANAAWSLEKLTAAWKIVARPEIRYVDLNSNFYADKDTRDGYLVFPAFAGQCSSVFPAGAGRMEEGGTYRGSTACDLPGFSPTPLPLIRFHSLDNIDFVDAAFTTRFGGESKGVLGSLNLGFNRGDTEENVRENFERCAAAMACGLEQMIVTDQVHGTRILRAEEGMGLGAGLRPRVTGVDGFWSETPGLTLCASFADCVPVYLVDPVGRRISLVHSGWKGTASQIAGKAVHILRQQGSRPSDIVAVIGPSISGARYEVTGEVIAAFRGELPGNVCDSCSGSRENIKNYDMEAEQLLRNRQLQRNSAVDIRQPDSDAVFQSNGAGAFSLYSEAELADIYVQTDSRHYHLDLWAAIYYTLIHSGLRPENIHFSGICTWENADILWSHRRSGGRRGNMNAFLKIR